MPVRVISSFLLLAFLAGCADKYKPYSSLYSFKSKEGLPDYASLDYWAAHPWKWDPSDSVPAPLRHEHRDTVADVFFLHPTTFTRGKKMIKANAGIDDAYINAKTDYSTILYQASVFNQHARIFAPRYRQAHIKNFFSSDKERADSAFAMAYEDIRTAFLYYMEHWNQGRPLIIASHSQGSLLAEKLLKEFFDGRPLQEKLVAAYIIGWQVPKDYFTSLPVCDRPDATGCFCSWRTFRKNFIPSYLKEEKGNAWVTNPLSWTTTPDKVFRDKNPGSVLTRFNTLYKHSCDAWISNGLLYTRRPRFPWGFLYRTRTYHIGDINLYYLSIRKNITDRLKAWKKN